MENEFYKAKKEIKHELKEKLSQDEVFAFVISVEESKLLNWEHDKEFEYQGEMYDVIESQIKSDSIHYLLWWDHKESALHKKLGQLLNLAWGNSENKERSLISSVFSLFHYLNQANIKLNYIPEIALSKWAEPSGPIYFDEDLQIETPPPKGY